ncbi:hypothetical protein Tco_0411591 [Tanacetum coccineum]
MDGGICHSRMRVEKIYMTNSVHEEEYFNPLDIEDDVFSYESHACLIFEQHTQSYDNESVDTIDSANNMQELEDKHKDMVRGPNLERIISRWHMCKPVRVFYDNEYGKDFRMWPTCNLDLSFCSEYDAIYEKGKNGILEQWMCFRDHERQSVGGNRMTFVDFLKVRYGNKSIDDTTRERRYYEWIVQNTEFNANGIPQEATMYDNHYSFDVEIDYGKTRDDPYSRRLINIRRSNAKNFLGILYTNGTMRDSRKKSDGRVLDDALPLGRANSSRFMGMIRKEMDDDGNVQRKT